MFLTPQSGSRVRPLPGVQQALDPGLAPRDSAHLVQPANLCRRQGAPTASTPRRQPAGRPPARGELHVAADQRTQVLKLLPKKEQHLSGRKTNASQSLFKNES